MTYIVQVVGAARGLVVLVERAVACAAPAVQLVRLLQARAAEEALRVKASVALHRLGTEQHVAVTAQDLLHVLRHRPVVAASHVLPAHRALQTPATTTTHNAMYFSNKLLNKRTSIVPKQGSHVPSDTNISNGICSTQLCCHSAFFSCGL